MEKETGSQADARWDEPEISKDFGRFPDPPTAQGSATTNGINKYEMTAVDADDTLITEIVQHLNKDFSVVWTNNFGRIQTKGNLFVGTVFLSSDKSKATFIGTTLVDYVNELEDMLFQDELSRQVLKEEQIVEAKKSGKHTKPK